MRRNFLRGNVDSPPNDPFRCIVHVLVQPWLPRTTSSTRTYLFMGSTNAFQVITRKLSCIFQKFRVALRPRSVPFCCYFGDRRTRLSISSPRYYYFRQVCLILGSSQLVCFVVFFFFFSFLIVVRRLSRSTRASVIRCFVT